MTIENYKKSKRARSGPLMLHSFWLLIASQCNVVCVSIVMMDFRLSIWLGGTNCVHNTSAVKEANYYCLEIWATRVLFFTGLIAYVSGKYP